MSLSVPVLESPQEKAEPGATTSTQTRLEPLYHVLLFDDDEHSYDYVIEMMAALFGMSTEDGFRVAYDVDNLGEALIKTCPLDEAVAGRDAIHAFGPDLTMSNSHGSMKAAVSRAE